MQRAPPLLLSLTSEVLMQRAPPPLLSLTSEVLMQCAPLPSGLGAPLVVGRGAACYHRKASTQRVINKREMNEVIWFIKAKVSTIQSPLLQSKPEVQGSPLGAVGRGEPSGPADFMGRK